MQKKKKKKKKDRNNEKTTNKLIFKNCFDWLIFFLFFFGDPSEDLFPFTRHVLCMGYKSPVGKPSVQLSSVFVL